MSSPSPGRGKRKGQTCMSYIIYRNKKPRKCETSLFIEFCVYAFLFSRHSPSISCGLWHGGVSKHHVRLCLPFENGNHEFWSVYAFLVGRFFLAYRVFKISGVIIEQK